MHAGWLFSAGGGALLVLRGWDTSPWQGSPLSILLGYLSFVHRCQKTSRGRQLGVVCPAVADWSNTCLDLGYAAGRAQMVWWD